MRSLCCAVMVMMMVSFAGVPDLRGQQPKPVVIQQAERDRAAFNAAGALARYEAALSGSPDDYDLLWRAARESVDLAEAAATGSQRSAYNVKAEAYARRAVAANAAGADGHFMLAVALGRTALSVGARERMKYATEIHGEAMTAVKTDPRHAGALHVLGVWNAEVMRLNGFTRFAARKFLGGKVFDQASWSEAKRYMEAAVASDPGRITHRLDLAKIYAYTGDATRARTVCETALAMPVVEFNDARYKQQCEQLLTSLR
ncbi:MAG TPA: hypothetical protein VE861_10190 [Gemmatimonadaceae bacterium]|nr:hypothetical protein [Gemmatimonadaceae bacterium]